MATERRPIPWGVMPEPRRRPGRRLTIPLLALVAGLIVLPAGTATGTVTRADLDAAESEAAQAAARLGAAEEDLSALLEVRQRLEVAIVRLEREEVEIIERAEEEGASIKERIARLYMAAGDGAAHLVIGDIAAFAIRTAYSGAVADRDRELVIQFALTVTDLERLRTAAQVQLAQNLERESELEQARARRAEELDGARRRLATLRQQWEREEAARQAAIEAEIRRREEELAAQATTTTTVPAGTTTTTTVPSYTYVPSAGVEQWRPLVTEVFTRWGLHQTKCATRNGVEFCVGPQIDNALQVMQCESSGNPMAVNSRTGVGGLFQNHPAYWQGRVDRVRAQHSDKEPNFPADASMFNPEHNTVVAALLVWESRETLLGNRGGGGWSPAVWPEFNFERYEEVGRGYSVWGLGPNPWGHWSCGGHRGMYDGGWIHPWATRRQAP